MCTTPWNDHLNSFIHILLYFTGFLFCSDIKTITLVKRFLDSDLLILQRFWYSIHPEQKQWHSTNIYTKQELSLFTRHVKLSLTGTKNKYDVVSGWVAWFEGLIQTAGPRRPLRSACSWAPRSGPKQPSAWRSPSPSSHGAVSSSPGSS